jgi:tripartite-type tricarboxylate transporter receptor subunit TctC
MSISSRLPTWLSRLAFAALVPLAANGAANAQTFPDPGKQIRIIVPAGAASVTDLLARVYAKAMTETSGVSAIVENRAGAEMVIGVQSFMGSPPDGYTLMFTTSSSQVLNPVMIPNLPYDPLKQMVPISGIARGGLVMNLGPSTPFQNARDFVAAARANPGKYTCASASTTTRLACELLQVTAGVKLLNVPYKATAAAATAVSSGETDVIFIDAGSARALWQTGRLRGVAVTQTTRMPTLANLPTLREDGVADYDLSAWYAAYAPLGTPPDVTATLRAIMRKAGSSKAVIDTLASFSIEPLDLVGDDLTAMNRREIEKWSKLVREQGIKPAY